MSEQLPIETLRQYLLGELPPGEVDALEQKMFEDDECFDTLHAVEAELLDDYTAGTLSESHRRALERTVLASPHGRSRLAFAETLSVAAQASPTTASNRGWWKRLSGFLWPDSVGARIGVAAAVAVAAIVIWQSTGPSREAFYSGDAIAIAAIDPVTTRSAAKPAQVHIGAARYISLNLRLADEPIPQRYRAELHRGKQLVFRTDGHANVSMSAVAVTIPTTKLSPGRYEITLFNTKTNSPQPVAHYVVDVTR